MCARAAAVRYKGSGKGSFHNTGGAKRLCVSRRRYMQSQQQEVLPHGNLTAAVVLVRPPAWLLSIHRLPGHTPLRLCLLTEYNYIIDVVRRVNNAAAAPVKAGFDRFGFRWRAAALHIGRYQVLCLVSPHHCGTTADSSTTNHIHSTRALFLRSFRSSSVIASSPPATSQPISHTCSHSFTSLQSPPLPPLSHPPQMSRLVLSGHPSRLAIPSRHARCLSQQSLSRSILSIPLRNALSPPPLLRLPLLLRGTVDPRAL